MKCYSCSRNEAESRLLVNYMGHSAEIHLCTECLEGLRQYASSILKEVREKGLVSTQPYAWPNFELSVPPQIIADGEDTPPMDVGEEIRRRRRLGELKENLRDAVRNENYESAAALRDEIFRIEKEVCVQ